MYSEVIIQVCPIFHFNHRLFVGVLEGGDEKLWDWWNEPSVSLFVVLIHMIE